MPGRQSHGRQAHGRPLLALKPAPKNFRKSKAKAQAKALDAFTIASEQYPTKEKRTPRFREIEAQPEGGNKKHSRDEEDEDEDEDEDEEEQPRRKKAKPSAGGEGDDSDEYGSDSEGNEWHYGVNDDEDSELDSDEAFGESDEEDFQGYAFRGSKSGKDEEDESEEEDGDSLGEDAIDLAQALDEYESDESMADGDDGSEGSESEDEADSPPSSDSEDEEDDEADPSKLGELQKFIAGYGGNDDEDAAPTKQKQKINLKDLGLAGVKDAQMRKSVKLMAKEEKETRPGASKKLDVPLARRQQDKLQRAAAYEKANDTLGRWQETVKHNRRAEHLVFPLPQNAADEGLDNRELQAITPKNAATSELEQTIMSIMQQSGLALNKQEENKMKKAQEEEGLSKEALKDLVNQRRRERELNSREAKRAARIKKIKSKAYHRVHRKEKEREEMKLHEAMAENGEIDSEAERDAADRARALERVGARHRDSKWAKLGASNKRAVWDDDYRAGLHDMARREDELRKRKEGRAGKSDSEASEEDDEEDSDGSDFDEEGQEKRALLKQLKRVEDDKEDGPAKGLMQMKFMQKAEAAQKKANDELIAQIRRDLASDDEEGDEEEEVAEVGRKKFGSAAKPAISAPALSKSSKKSKKAVAADDDDDAPDNSVLNTGYSITATPATAGSAWSSGPRKKSSKSQPSGARVADLDNTQAMTAAAPKPKSKSQSKALTGEDSDADSDEGVDIHLPLAIRDIAQMDKAFAGDDVVVDFAREKAEAEAEDDDKIVDNTLPGWGGWVGDGVSNREKKRQQGRFLTKVEGIKKADRKDAKLEKVIISEKRVKKNDKYLASQLPHPFESRAQYERSLRLPMGPEWVTKESFQEATKPRILKKQGIIAPMSRPTM